MKRRNFITGSRIVTAGIGSLLTACNDSTARTGGSFGKRESLESKYIKTLSAKPYGIQNNH